MERKLTTTIKLGKGFIRIVCLENISTNTVEIFNSTQLTSNPLEQTKFIKQSINEINSKIAGEIKQVIAIIESNKKTDLEIKMVNKEMTLPSSFVTNVDIDNIIALAKRNVNINGKEVILAQPVRFHVMDVTKKAYNKAPINKKGHTLSVRMAVSAINSKVAQYARDIISSANLELIQIVTDAHTYAHETISGSALAEGAISINVGMKRVSITVNANFATISNNEIKLGFRDLVKAVAQQFNCSYETSMNLIKIHGSTIGDEEEIIFTSNQGLKIISYTTKHLSEIIKQFFKKILEFSHTYISSFESFKKLPVTFSGEITPIKNIIPFAQEFLDTEYIQVYKPLNFISINIENVETIAVKNLIERYNKIIGKTFNTIVMTNPNSIEFFNEPKEGKILRFIGNILGGIHARAIQKQKFS